MAEWFEDYADKGFGLKSDETGEDEAGFITRVLRLQKGQSVLDAPCGAGRISVHLAKAGCRVTGLDLTEAFIHRAQTRFAKETLNGEFHVLDMRRINFCEQFDAVVNWQGSFGYFSETENLDVLRCFARALRKGGRVMIDQINREYLLRNFLEKRELGDLTTRNSWNARTQRVKSVWTRTIDGQRRSHAMSIRLYTPAQFRTMFEQVGLLIQAAYGSIAAEPYCRASKRLVVVGQKP